MIRIRRVRRLYMMILALIALPLVPVISGALLAAYVIERWWQAKTDSRPVPHTVELTRERALIRRMIS